MQLDNDNSLLSYFTDMEHQRDMFMEYVAAEKLSKRLIVFHGVGGVGKSSLLRIFRLQCKREKIPVGLVSGDDAKSVVDVITGWAEELKIDGARFSAFSKTLETYRAIQAKVDDQAKKNQSKVADIASKAAAKTAETAGGALLGAAIGSVIPGLGTAIGGTLGGVVSGMGAEALTDWLRGFLSKPDVDLLLDPAKKLSTDFLDDLAKVADKKRIVLLIDTFEQMSALEDWLGESIQKIHSNVLIVIAGRKLPDWHRSWSGWMMTAHVEELKPMTEDTMRELVLRYYATMRGGLPDPIQVETIVRFARGLPMVVTSAVQLWVKYGLEDFQSVKPEIVANLVDRLMEGIPSALIPALEAAAVVRWFDQPILRAVLKREDVRDVYNELRRFPFVRTRIEGLALHDSVREMMDENLRVQDSERHAELHKRAAEYFEHKIENPGEDVSRFELELLYHRVRNNEETGYNFFQELAESLSLLRLSMQLRTLINDVQVYASPTSKIGILIRFYLATLYRREHLYDEAIRIYQDISEEPKADTKLKAYALCNLGEIYANSRFLEKEHGVERALDTINKSLAFNLMDSRLIQNYFSLSRISVSQGKLGDAKQYLQKARLFFEMSHDDYGQLIILSETKELGRYGLWGDYLSAHKAALEYLSSLPKTSKSFTYLRGKILRKWARVWAFTGRNVEGEGYLKECLQLEKELQDNITPAYTMRDLGWILGYQDKFEDAYHYFQSSLKITEGLGENFFSDRGRVLGLQGVILTRQGALGEAESSLNESLRIHAENPYFPGSIFEVHNWLGLLAETKGDWTTAQQYYLMHSNSEWHGQIYFSCCAQTGLIRSKYALGDYSAIPALIVQCEQIAQTYEYNDHLASIRLIQGHLGCENGNLEEAIGFYMNALIYALRFNRFLLDELVSGRPQRSPLRHLIPHLLERGTDGRKILSALRDWWKMGVNAIGAPRSDTISPIIEGISLLEAEKIAREREPGNGASQMTLVEQIEAAISL